MRHSLAGNFGSKNGDPERRNQASGVSDAQLWESFREGDRKAFDVIFESNVRTLYAYGRNFASDSDLVSDCIQDVFIELWIKREAVAANVNSIKYYLIKAVRRRIARRLSEERRLKAQPIPENYCDAVEFNIENSIIEDQIFAERSVQLQRSVANLSKGQQEAIYLRFHENLSCEEVASVMKINVKSVYNLISRSIFSLRQFFEAHPIAH